MQVMQVMPEMQAFADLQEAYWWRQCKSSSLAMPGTWSPKIRTVTYQACPCTALSKSPTGRSLSKRRLLRLYTFRIRPYRAFPGKLRISATWLPLTMGCQQWVHGTGHSRRSAAQRRTAWRMACTRSWMACPCKWCHTSRTHCSSQRCSRWRRSPFATSTQACRSFACTAPPTGQLPPGRAFCSPCIGCLLAWTGTSGQKQQRGAAQA